MSTTKPRETTPPLQGGGVHEVTPKPKPERAPTRKERDT